MGKFVKKPVEIDAWQFTGDNASWFIKEFGIGRIIEKDGNLIVHTWEGDMKALPGDWIIMGIKGELYPCKSDVFEATYEVH